MKTINIHEVEANLSWLVDQAAQGESFIIAKAGKPLVKVVACDAPATNHAKRIGFMTGQIVVPDDFNDLTRTEIEAIFGEK
ncbi:type II toxin-antitoxin system Phd/YefM family antitoxin [Massilia glaciei]|uniref:Antitoxin n=1 Tax=Massilia glaciei TaxID=1524097 RepID=A0A2U2I709_9BURK|nr:type II toxin-antitoxin system Phd/YefM family antitoxin [Massilia glaciei]PWF55543.1 type II toxin-antitoxin system prevent-host-death family antitoxin [Massilia glaciei]